MIDRLKHLLESEKLSYSGFADLIGVQRSSVSHIMSGRNKPSFDFLQKTMRALSHLNADWLILGEGNMYEPGYEDMGSGDIFSGRADQSMATGEIPPDDTEEQHIPAPVPKKGSHASDDPEARRVRRIILLYDDNSFESYEAGS